MKLPITILFVLCFGPLWSQSFSGIILDNGTKEPVYNAVFLMDQKPLGYTDIDGHFSFQLRLTNAELTIKSSGYKTKIINTKDYSFTNVTIFLERRSEMLEDIEVNTTRLNETYEESPVSIDVVKPYIINQSVPVSIQETFNQSPGVNVTDGQANIRSGSGWSYGAGSRVLVLLDGMPLYSADAGQVQWDLLPFESTEQMEVIKGANSTSFGSSAMNGIIQLTTKNPLGKPKTNIQFSQGIYDNPSNPDWKWWDGARGISHLKFSTQNKSGKNGWLIGGQALYDAGFQFMEETERVRVHSKFAQEEKNVTWGIEGSLMYNKTGESLIWKSYDTPYLPLDSSATQTTSFDGFLGGNLTIRQKSGTHLFKTRVLSVNNDAKSELTNYENYSVQSMSEYQYKHYYKYFTFLLGGNYNYGTSTSEIFNGTYRTHNAAAFSEAQFKWKGFNVSGGVRYEVYQLDNRQFSKPVFRAGANYRLGSSTHIRASIGQGYRFPSMAETYPTTNIGAINIYPNPELQPESGWTAEIGIKQGLKLGGWKGFLDVSGFIMEYDNMMEFSFAQWNQPSGTDFGIGFKSINVGETRITGTEITLIGTGKISNIDIRALTGYSYMLPIALNPEAPYANSFNGNPVTYNNSSSDPSNGILKYRYQHLLKIDLMASYKRFTVGINLQGYSSMQNVDAIFGAENSIIEAFYPGIGMKRAMDDLNTPKILTDFRIIYKINDSMSLGFNGKNIFNEALLIRPAKLSAPRTFFLQFNYQI